MSVVLSGYHSFSRSCNLFFGVIIEFLLEVLGKDYSLRFATVIVIVCMPGCILHVKQTFRRVRASRQLVDHSQIKEAKAVSQGRQSKNLASSGATKPNLCLVLLRPLCLYVCFTGLKILTIY